MNSVYSTFWGGVKRFLKGREKEDNEDDKLSGQQHKELIKMWNRLFRL
jgi:hypothetical protein